MEKKNQPPKVVFRPPLCSLPYINNNGKLKEYLFLPRVQSFDLTLPKYEGNSRKIKRQNSVKKR